MARFLEIEELISEARSTSLIGVGAINYIFNYEGRAVINTSNRFKIITNSYKDVCKLLIPFQFNKTELNGNSISVRGLDTKDKGIEAIINLNKIASLYGTWQGEIDFEDGTTVETNFSPYGSINSLKLDYGDFILRHRKEE